MIRLFLALLLASLLAPGASAQEFVEFPDENPTLIGGIEALQRSVVYPAEDRRAGVQGRVIVQFDVAADASVSNVRAVRSVSPGLDSAAVRAVRAARVTPPRHQGRPVWTTLTIPITFRIRDDEARTPPPVLDEPLNVSEQPPELLGGIEALQRLIQYPEADRRAGVQGRVIVQFVVNTDGRPTDLTVFRGVSAGIDTAAVQAVRASRFRPGVQDGRTVRTRMTLPITFRLPGAPVDPALFGQAPAGPSVSVGDRWQPAFDALADSGAVVSGQGRVRLGGAGQRRVTVVDSIVTELETTFREGSESARSVAETRTRLNGATGLRRRPDGFFHAADMVAAGLPVAFDIGFSTLGRTVRERLPQCDRERFPTCTLFPMPLGGFSGIWDRAGIRRLSGAERAPVSIQVEIDREGRVVSAEAVRIPNTRRQAPTFVTEALLGAVRETVFVMDPRDAEMAPDERLTLTLPTFRPPGMTVRPR